ncbi:MAG: TIGR00645 family protein [Syntrophaceae bacterium]|nr:TIGR00645 family protein [Syntrophaceae bacterium]HQM45013.1 TIGR00645 family protein [Smithellaceae bacterium]
MRNFEKYLEQAIYKSRWLLVPLYIGLIAANVLLLIKFVKEFIKLIPLVLYGEGGQVIAGLLSLIDIVLVANLMLIIIFAGYENFVSKIDMKNHEDRPDWMGKIGFSDLKMKVVGSIVAISAIELLRAFMNLDVACSTEQLAWKVGIHITFVFSGIGFAVMDRLSAKD